MPKIKRVFSSKKSVTLTRVEPHYPVKREGVIEKASIHWHTVAYANMYRADGRVEAILPE
jgi:hypothetical protein